MGRTLLKKNLNLLNGDLISFQPRLARTICYNGTDNLDIKKKELIGVNYNGYKDNKSTLWSMLAQDSAKDCGFDILDLENNSEYLDVFLGVKPNFLALKKVVQECAKQKCF